jgi:hypothetical protein
LLTQAMIFAHLLQGSLNLTYVFAFPLECYEQRLLFVDDGTPTRKAPRL